MKKKDPKTGEVTKGPMEYFCYAGNLNTFFAFKLENDRIKFQIHRSLWNEHEFKEKKICSKKL